MFNAEELHTIECAIEYRLSYDYFEPGNPYEEKLRRLLEKVKAERKKAEVAPQ